MRYCGRSDLRLDARGHRDARRLAADLVPVVRAGARVVSSPLRRAQETARYLARDLAIDERLAEVDLGCADGLTFAELQRDWPAITELLLRGASDRIDWPGGESADMVRERARAFCSDLDGDAVVVTHGFLAHAIARELGATPAFLHPGYALRVER